MVLIAVQTVRVKILIMVQFFCLFITRLAGVAVKIKAVLPHEACRGGVHSEGTQGLLRRRPLQRQVQNLQAGNQHIQVRVLEVRSVVTGVAVCVGQGGQGVVVRVRLDQDGICGAAHWGRRATTKQQRWRNLRQRRNSTLGALVSGDGRGRGDGRHYRFPVGQLRATRPEQGKLLLRFFERKFGFDVFAALLHALDCVRKNVRCSLAVVALQYVLYVFPLSHMYYHHTYSSIALSICCPSCILHHTLTIYQLTL